MLTLTRTLAHEPARGSDLPTDGQEDDGDVEIEAGGRRSGESDGSAEEAINVESLRAVDVISENPEKQNEVGQNPDR